MSTGWEIGAKAREALALLLYEAYRFSHTEFMRHVQQILDRCTDADAEGAQELYEALDAALSCGSVNDQWWVEKARAALAKADADQGEPEYEIGYSVIGGELQPVYGSAPSDADDVAKSRQLLTDDDESQQGEQEPVAWLPMETAPKDGTPIVALCKHDADPYYETKDRLTIYGSHCEGLSHVPDGIHVVVWGGEDSDVDEFSGRSYTIPAWWFRSGSEFEEAANPIGWQHIGARPPVGLPPGWVAVPVEPDSRMKQSGAPVMNNMGPQYAEACYRAMLAAAPPYPGAVELPEGWPWTPEVREYLRFLLFEARERAIRHVNADTADAAFELARWLEAQGAAEQGGSDG